MARKSPSKRLPERESATLMVRLDPQSKAALAQAAALRKISMSDYVRSVTVAQALREVEEAQSNSLTLAPAEQIAFFEALKAPVKLTAKQRQLQRIVQGEA
jgi:uncharacterized protein (DUF1778 family)